MTRLVGIERVFVNVNTLSAGRRVNVIVDHGLRPGGQNNEFGGGGGWFEKKDV